jgi:anti-anti-sigma factor
MTISPSRPPGHLRFRLRLGGDGWQIAVHGDLDIASASCLVDLIGPITSQPHRRVELDLAAVTFIDLRGLGALDDFADGCSARGVSVAEVRPAPCVQHLRDLRCALIEATARTERLGRCAG